MNNDIFNSKSNDDPITLGLVGIKKAVEDQTRTMHRDQHGPLGMPSLKKAVESLDSNTRQNHATLGELLHHSKKREQDDRNMVNSLVSNMKREVFTVKISDTMNSIVMPLYQRMGILAEDQRKLRERFEREHFLYYERFLIALNKGNEENQEVNRGLWVTLQQFQRHPLWSAGRVIVSAFKGMAFIGTTAFKVLFGLGDRETVQQKTLKEIKKQTEFFRTGTIHAERRGIFRELIRGGLIGTAFNEITKEIAQRSQNRIEAGGSAIRGTRGLVRMVRGRGDLTMRATEKSIGFGGQKQTEELNTLLRIEENTRKTETHTKGTKDATLEFNPWFETTTSLLKKQEKELKKANMMQRLRGIFGLIGRMPLTAVLGLLGGGATLAYLGKKIGGGFTDQIDGFFKRTGTNLAIGLGTAALGWQLLKNPYVQSLLVAGGVGYTLATVTKLPEGLINLFLLLLSSKGLVMLYLKYYIKNLVNVEVCLKVCESLLKFYLKF